ncbi:hypothetical protein OSB04_020897 [Centaurea solstitialis]|uniref:Retrotransposon Copia-like N-terminal domain-containing protein n=1 Tax=Centaurea solstitialis TaxID=347529 RepID=A0AA38ST62_9ASTR|nr:hypothetical protein OSB04_020897 [Centaurea solstitialis]
MPFSESDSVGGGPDIIESRVLRSGVARGREKGKDKAPYPPFINPKSGFLIPSWNSPYPESGFTFPESGFFLSRIGKLPFPNRFLPFPNRETHSSLSTSELESFDSDKELAFPSRDIAFPFSRVGKFLSPFDFPVGIFHSDKELAFPSRDIAFPSRELAIPESGLLQSQVGIFSFSCRIFHTPMTSNLSHSNPISVVLNGNNYILWNHHMTILLKYDGLYSYVTGTTVAPTRTANESATDYAKRLNEWDINNAKILGFINASTTAEIN